MSDPLARTVSWLHFGDLHITTEDEQNYRDLVALVADANAHVAGDVDFAVLPGDNADDGTADEYRSICKALAPLAIPLEIRTGDHDRKSGTLDAYVATLEPRLYRTRIVGPYRCLFLDSLDGRVKEDFDLGPEQLRWFLHECDAAQRAGETLALFMHAYPSEFAASGPALRDAIARYPVATVDMGHTHYNEVAADGHTVYMATRSTGQIEEGPVGFSITTIDRGVVSWKFNELGRWPFVKIVSPAARDLIIDPAAPDQVLRGEIEIRARVWGAGGAAEVTCRIDGGDARPMTRVGETNLYALPWNASEAADGDVRIEVRAATANGTRGDAIVAYGNRAGAYDPPRRAPRDSDNALGADVEKGLLATRLGPNANGRKW